MSSPLDIADGRQAAPPGGEGLHATAGRGRREEEDGFDSDLVNYHYPGGLVTLLLEQGGRDASDQDLYDVHLTGLSYNDQTDDRRQREFRLVHGALSRQPEHVVFG